MTGARSSRYQPLWIGAAALVVLPLCMHAIGLTTNTASTVVILAIATMGLNLCVGYTGLVSFGHGAWFGIGAYAAALIQKHWFGDEIALPILLSMAVSYTHLDVYKRQGITRSTFLTPKPSSLSSSRGTASRRRTVPGSNMFRSK